MKKNTVARKKAKLHKIAKEAGVKLEKGAAKVKKALENGQSLVAVDVVRC